MSDNPTVIRRVEWSVHLVGELGVLGTDHTFSALESQAMAEARLAWWRQHRPDVRSELVARQVEIVRGPWAPAVTGTDQP